LQVGSRAQTCCRIYGRASAVVKFSDAACVRACVRVVYVLMTGANAAADAADAAAAAAAATLP